MSTDKWPKSGGMTTFGRRGSVVTPSDTVDLEELPKAIVVLQAGTLAIIPDGNEDEDVIEFDEVPVGWSPPYIVRRVMATNTGATVATVDD